MAKTPILTGLSVLVLAGALVAGAATAQSRRPNTSDQPVSIGADHGGITSDGGFSLSGRAEVTQGGARLRADTITGVGSGGQIRSITARGNVYYVTPTESIRGDQATYSVSDATIVVSGDVILTQGQNVLTGSRLTYNVDTGAANMDGGSTGRVRGVFYPNGSSN